MCCVERGFDELVLLFNNVVEEMIKVVGCIGGFGWGCVLFWRVWECFI